MPTAFDDLLTDAPTTQAEAAQGGFDDLLDDAPPQSPLETGVRSFAMAPGQTAATAMSGVGRVRQALSDTIGTRLPSAIAPIAKGAFDVATTVPRLLGPLATDIAAEHERVYNPDATRNPKAAAGGSGMGQMLPMAASAIVAGPAAPLALGAAQGADQGIAQAEEMGITDPARKLAMGAAYAGTEAAIEKIGGVGSKAFTDAAKRTFGQAVKEGVKTMASEAGEEPLTGAIQDAIAARFAPDTYDVTPLAPVIPSVEGDTWEFNPQFWNRRKLETVGGGAGGFAAGTIQIAQNATQPSQPADATAQPAADVTPDPLAAHAQTMPSPAAPDYTQPSRPNYDDPGAMWGEMLTDQPPPMEGQVVEFAPPTTRAEDTANETATTEGSGLLDDPLGNPAVSIPPPATPAEAQTQAQESNVSVTSPPASEVTIPPAETRTEAPVVPTTDAGSTPATGGNYQGPAFGSTAPAMTREVPVIPDAPYGGRDVLDFVNDNPIAAPEPILDVIHEKKGAVLTPQQSGDYNWLKQGSVPKAYRKYFFTASSDGKSNINEVAQHAHDEGLIDDPTPDALMAKINEVIAARENYTSATKARDTQMAQQEKQTIAFDKAQAKLAKAKSNPGTRIGWDQMFPGDAMVIDGERVEVTTVDTDEDGYPTRVVLRGGEKFGTQTFDASVAGNGVLVNEWQPQPRRTIGFTNLEVDGETGGFLNTEIIREATDLLARGVRDFAAWSKSMLAKFGEAIRAHLGAIWRSIQNEARLMTTNKGSINPNGREIDSRATSERMASESEAAQNANEPSPGGLSEAEDYRGTHKAPTGEHGEGSLDAMDRTYPDDIYSANGARYYGDGNAAMDAQIHQIIRSVRGKPDAMVLVYRSVPKGVNAQIRPGDWVTPLKSYAVMHGRRWEQGHTILTAKVKASELFTEGNSMFEFGWSPPSSQTFGAEGRAPGFTNLDVSGSTAGFLNADLINEGASLIVRGVRDFAAWSKAMLSKFGEAIRTHLGTIWKHVQAEAKMLTTNKGSVGGDAISNRQTEPIRMTHAAEAERMAAEGKEPLPTGGQGTVEEWEAEARARVQQPGAAQALVADIIEKQRTHTPAEYYMLMHYAGALDAQMERLSQTVADPQTSEQERSQAAAILPGLDTERDRVAVAAQIAGSKAGAALGARSRGLERAVIPSLSKMVADLTLIDDPTGRRPLPPEERARIEKIHGEMTEKAAAVEKQEEKASTDSLHAELKKLLDEAHAEIAAQKEQIEIQQRALDNKLKPATLLTKTKATLTKWADDGEAALDELRAKGFFAQTNMAVDPSVILATARVIRGYMAKNAMKSGDAAAIIIKKLGHQAYAALEKFLPQILDKVKQIQAEELKKPTRENVIEKARKEMPKPGETAKVDPAQPMPAKATGKLDTLPALARKLALAHIIDHLERGDATMSAEKIAELVRADLEEFKPGITTREARDAISGYGDVKLPNKDIARKTMRDFRAQMQKLTQLEALMAQERLLKSGVQRDQPSARLRELQKQVEELKRQTGYESRSREDELRSARDRIKTSLNNQIEELQRILAGKARPAAGKERVIYDAELQSLQTMRNALKDLVAEMPEHKRASETRRNKAALKAAKAIEAEYKRRLAAEEWHARRTTATPSPELAAARADAAKARNAFEQARKSRTGDTTGMQRAREQLAAAEKRVAEWQRRARDQQWTSPEAQPKAQGGRFAQVEAAKAMARQARAEFESLKKASDPRYNPDAVALRDFKRRIQQQITDLETRMAKGDFEPRKKTPREIKHDEQSKRLKHELQMTKRKWEETKLAHKLNNLSMPKKGWWYFRKAFHTSRSIMTGGEFSGLLRQGLLKTVSHPMRVMGNDIPAMIKAFRSEAGEFSVLSDIMTRPNALNGRYQTAKLAIDDPSDFSSQIAEGNARSDWLQQMSEWQSGLSGKVFHSTIGLAPRFINATGRAYTALLNHMRADLFDMMVDKLEAKKTTKGQALTEAELKAVADFVNDTTGAGKLGVIDNRPGAKDLMGMLIFAPAFVSSRIRTLFGASLIGGSMDTRQAIAGEYLRITAGMAAMFALAAALQSSTDDKPEEDPRSSNFGKVKYGKTAMDLTAGLGNTAVMIARTLMGEIKKQNGQIQPTRGEGVPYGGTTAGDVVGRWMRSKLSPGAGFTWNRITGTDYSGHPASFTTDTANLLKPITYSDVAEIWRSQPPARAVPLSAAAMLGFGTQTATDRPPMR